MLFLTTNRRLVVRLNAIGEQIKIASGLPLSLRQEDIWIKGCAIECRINAEDPLSGFIPAPGKIRAYHPPGGAGIRVDSGAFSSCSIPPFYDPLISKLIAWGRDRDEAIRKMQRALYEYIIVGIKSNIPFHMAVMANKSFVKGELSTEFIESEVTLIDDMKRIAERQKPLQEKLSHLSDEKKKIAAIAAAAMGYRNISVREHS